jgi:hypothetical protein
MLASHSNVVLNAFAEVREDPIWQIADNHYQMDRTHPPGTLWQVNRVPYVKTIMNWWQNETVKEIVLKAGSKNGKSTPILMCLAWSMTRRPVAKLWLSGNDQLADDAADEYVHPVLERCPDLSGQLLKDRTNNKVNRIRTRLCTLHIRGAQGKTVLEQMSYGEIFADECRQFPPGALSKLAKRQRNFVNAKRALFSTPDQLGDDFDGRFSLGSQCEWMFPCEGCETSIPIVFSKKYSQLPDPWKEKSQIMFPDGEACWLECKCNHRHFDVPSTRRWIVDHGDWVALNTSADRSIRHPEVESAHWNAFLPPDLSWQDHVDEFRLAMKYLKYGNSEPLRIFICETLGADWHSIIMTVDVQHYGFWFVARGWRKDGSSRLLDCGKLDAWGDITAKQTHWGIKNPRFVFLDARYNGAKVHAECARNGWTAFMGLDRKSFPHPHPKQKGKLVWRIYSQKRIVNCGIGRRRKTNTKPLYCREFYFAASTAEDMLQQHLDDTDLKFEIPNDVSREYRKQLKAKVPAFEKHKKTGAEIRFWKQIADDDHLRDCEKLQIVAASMAKLITITLEKDDAPDADPSTN